MTTVGDLMHEAKRRTFKGLAIFLGLAVYRHNPLRTGLGSARRKKT